jgi:hypothetical protein
VIETNRVFLHCASIFLDQSANNVPVFHNYTQTREKEEKAKEDGTTRRYGTCVPSALA